MICGFTLACTVSTLLCCCAVLTSANCHQPSRDCPWQQGLLLVGAQLVTSHQSLELIPELIVRVERCFLRHAANKTFHLICTRALKPCIGRTGLLPLLLCPAGYTVKHLRPFANCIQRSAAPVKSSARLKKKRKRGWPKAGLCCEQLHHRVCAKSPLTHSLVTRTSTIGGSLLTAALTYWRGVEKGDWRRDETGNR